MSRIPLVRAKWKSPAHRFSPRSHSSEIQSVIRTQAEESRATKWSQLHLVPKLNPNEWRFTLDFVRLNDYTGGFEGWPIPQYSLTHQNIETQDVQPNRLHFMRSRETSVFITADGLNQWTWVSMGLNGAGLYFQYRICWTSNRCRHRRPRECPVLRYLR